MSLDAGEILIRFLLYPGRRQAGVVDVSGDGTGWLVEDFSRSLQDCFRNVRIDDVEALVRETFRRYPRLTDWLRSVVTLAGTEIYFEHSTPFVREETFTQWRRLSGRLDPDSLILATFADQFHRSPRHRDLKRWGVLITSGDRDLDRLLKRERVADIHTHFEGCECASALWVDVLRDEESLYSLREYARSLDGTAIQTQRALDLATEIEHIEQARGAWMQLAAPKIRLRPLGDRAGKHLSPVVRHLWQERKVIGRGWANLYTDWDESLARSLDAVLFGRSLFLARQQMFPGGNPGLANFRRYFDRLKPLNRQPTWSVIDSKWNRMLSFAAESRLLERLELRIAPMKTVGEYARFFRHWVSFIENNEFIRNIRRRQRGPHDVFTFVVHFIRWPEERDSSFDREAFSNVRQELDQCSAALHLFRVQHPDLSRFITGVDVANTERNCPVDVFSPHLRLLRGVYDSESLEEDLSSPYLSSWHEIVERRFHRIPNLPRLGLTYHAGEDYYHPLDGIRTMWNAVTGTRMLAGDRIGHGLAAGANIEEHRRNLSGTNSGPRGDILDSLVWLYCRLGEVSGQERLMREIADEISILSMSVYGRYASPPELALVKRHRHRPPPGTSGNRRNIPDVVEQLIRAELGECSVRIARRENIPFPEVFRRIDPGVKHAQAALSNLLAEKGVVLEVNPSSNWATGAIALPSQHPALVMKSLAPSIKIAINCDDPGTFATRIENEYALILEALVTNGDTKEEAIAYIAHMRETAANAVF